MFMLRRGTAAAEADDDRAVVQAGVLVVAPGSAAKARGLGGLAGGLGAGAGPVQGAA